MARITPKRNWVARNIPVATDFNRIERNNQQAFDEIDAEEAARIAAINAEKSARIAAINAEESARIAAVSSEESARIAAINAEESARIAAINAEESARIAADSAESVARESADASLNVKIDTRLSLSNVGTHAMLKNKGSGYIGPNATVSGSGLSYSDGSGFSSGGTPPGEWRCMGACHPNYSTLFVRVS